MAAAENLQSAKDGYAAFAAGDAGGAMTNISDDIEWIVAGDSAVSGTKKGKQEVGAWWAQLGEKGAKVEPQHWFADGDMVAMFGRGTIDGHESETADLLTYNSDGQLIKFQSAGGEAVLNQVYG